MVALMTTHEPTDPNALIVKHLCAIGKALEKNFTLMGRPLEIEEIFSLTGLLPAMVKKAEHFSNLCLGYGLGSTFEKADPSLLGQKVTFDDATPSVIRYVCILDVLIEIINHAGDSNVSLDELMYE